MMREVCQWQDLFLLEQIDIGNILQLTYVGLNDSTYSFFKAAT